MPTDPNGSVPRPEDRRAAAYGDGESECRIGLALQLAATPIPDSLWPELDEIADAHH